MNDLLYPKKTPLLKIIDSERNNTIYLKDETKQYTNAFKYRGVFNKFQKVDLSDYSGVITSSTGNHGQAVSFLAKQYNIKCIVVLPYNTPDIKKQKILKYGATIYQNDKLLTYAQCTMYAKKTAIAQKYLYIPSFDDIDIIDGHKKMFDEIKNIDFNYCFCPIGGGGLISAALQSEKLAKTNIIGVELCENDAMRQSLNVNRNIEIELSTKNGKSFCEGVLVNKVGDIPFEIALKSKLNVQTVKEHDVEKAIKLLNIKGIKSEGAGAISYAAYLNSEITCSKVLCIISGGNIDYDVFEKIIEEDV